jgi:hypothetical protein
MERWSYRGNMKIKWAEIIIDEVTREVGEKRNILSFWRKGKLVGTSRRNDSLLHVSVWEETDEKNRR